MEAFTQKGFLYVIIEDNGRGFTGISMEHLFDKYSTGGTGSVGLGMGLYLCKKILEMHNGDIVAGISEKIG